MKKMMIIVAFAVIAVATQAQDAVMVHIAAAPATFEISVNETEIVLSGSEVGVMYQLYTYEDKEKIAIGGLIEGTGKPIVFVYSGSEIVEVMAVDTKTGCSVIMGYPSFDTIVAPNRVVWTTEQTNIETTPMVKTGDSGWKEIKKE